MEAAEELYNLPLDKAATKIEKFSSAIDLLGKKLDNAIGSKKKNKLIDRQTAKEKKTLGAYRRAESESAKALKEAGKALTDAKTLKNSGVSKKERDAISKAVKGGKEIGLSYFTEGSSGYNAAVKYNSALRANKKAKGDHASAKEDYKAWLVESAKQKFDNVADDYEKRLQGISYQMDAVDRKIEEAEARGESVSKSYYESQKSINEETKKKLKEEKAALKEQLKHIKKGTDEWYEANDAIGQVNGALSGCVKTEYELNNAISQLHFDQFNKASGRIGRIITEQEFLQGLFAHEETTDADTGSLTEAGTAKLGSLSASYYASKERADNDAEELKELQRMLSSGTLHSDVLGVTFNSFDDLKEKVSEVYDKWQDDIKGTYSMESSIADLMKEKYQAELDMLKVLIDKKKEALDAEKD